jgi:hypothetical protein
MRDANISEDYFRRYSSHITTDEFLFNDFVFGIFELGEETCREAKVRMLPPSYVK